MWGPWRSRLLEGQFGPAGMLLIVLAAGVVGLVLCHDVLLVWPAQELDSRRSAVPVARPGIAVAGTGGDLVPSPVRRSVESRAGRARRGPDGRAGPSSGPDPAGPTAGVPGRGALAGSPAASVPRIAGNGQYQPPPLDLLEPPPPFPIHEHEAKINQRALLLERTLLDFGFNVRVVEIDTGPVITQFEIELEAGLRVSKIIGLADDLAIALRVPSVRIVAPIPGKKTVGIEVPNERRGDGPAQRGDRGGRRPGPSSCGSRSSSARTSRAVPLVFDLADMPHLLIAGRTGTGKSVCLNAIILSILMTQRPDEVKLILIDPKMVELSQLQADPAPDAPGRHRHEEGRGDPGLGRRQDGRALRYLARAGVRHIQTYNQLGDEEIYERLQPEDDEERRRIPTYMPYIVIVADEMADLMMTAGKEVEQHIIRLAQKSRAVGIHLILATQKPTVDVITGLIKSNLPARIAFQVASRTD